MGGDHMLYYLLNISSVTRADLVLSNSEYAPFELALDSAIEDIVFEIESEGALALRD